MSEEAQTSKPESTPELRTGLADIDRKLRALQDELAAAGTGEAVTPAPAPALAPPPPPPAPTRSPAGDAAHTAEDLALAIIARAEEQASRIVDDAHERVVALNRQAEQLMALRDGLRRSARELLDTYASALAQIEHDTAPVPPGPPAPLPEQPAGVTGAFTITAEPFAQVADLAAFTQALQRVPGATSVTVRGFDGRRADIGATFSEPVALVRELHRVMPFAVEVTEERPDGLSLRLDAGPAGAQ